MDLSVMNNKSICKMSNESLNQEFSYSKLYSEPLPFSLDIVKQESEEPEDFNSNFDNSEEKTYSVVDRKNWFLSPFILKTEIEENSPETPVQNHENFGLYATPTFDLTSTSNSEPEKSNDLENLHQNNVEPFPCPVQTFPCPFCPFETTTFENFSTHIMSIHAIARKFKCTDCDYYGKSKLCLQRHSVVHSNADQNTFYCPRRGCGYMTIVQRNMNKHMMKNHAEKIIVQKCSFCSYTTYQQEYLIRHLQTRHPTPPENQDSMPFHCQMCPYKGKHQGNLTRHMQLHSNEIEEKALLKLRTNAQSQL